MLPSLDPSRFLSQLPAAPPPPVEISNGPGGIVGTAVAIAVGLALLLLVVLAVRRTLKKRPPATLPTPAAGKELPVETPQLRVELPPTEAELVKRRELEEAHRAAEELKARRTELAAEAARAAESTEKARLEAEAKALKEQEEEAKRAEYRAKKAAEAEEKERHRREVEETARARAEAEAKAREEEAARARAAAEAERKKVEAESGQTLSQGLSKTRTQGFMARLNGLFGGGARQVDESVLGELEEVLFTADIGVKTAAALVEQARDKAKRNELGSADKLKGMIRQEIERIVDVHPASVPASQKPRVIMVVGVNGAGKTTTIGKLAAQATAQGKKVLLIAGDTFRAAAAEQLDVWAERAKAELVKGPDEADPASVVFDGVKKGVAEGADLIIADTAGRLHTKAPLMDELKKVKRVMGKALADAPHQVLLVLDATNGQNAIQQAKQFHEAVGVTDIALTKLDGTAKGGVVIGICDELKLPVTWVGIGEKVADLRPFQPKEFVAALFD